MKIIKVTFVVLAISIIGCKDSNVKEKEIINNHIINEEFQTPRNEDDNVDSPAFWKNDSLNWIIATAKSADCLIVNDALTGKEIKRIGKEGSELGDLKRPNGIFVIDSLLLVVERDNKRAQVFTLPNFTSLGVISDSLINPYGLFIYKDSTDVYNLYVTDDYKKNDTTPPDEELDKRVHYFKFNVNNGVVDWQLVKKFGATSGAGTLHVVESIWGDPENNILLISEEDTTQSTVKVYDLDGNFTGKVIGKGDFQGQVEGIALYKEGDEGYFIVADQSYDANKFVIYSRKSLEKITYFVGPKTTNTDGIWVVNIPFAKFSKGAFFAVHNDGNVSAFDWAKIEKLILTP